jgi:hypothetical protein
MTRPDPAKRPIDERLRERLREIARMEPEPLEPGDAEALAEGRAAAARGDVMTTDELLAYLARCDAGDEPDDD